MKLMPLTLILEDKFEVEEKKIADEEYIEIVQEDDERINKKKDEDIDKEESKEKEIK